MERIISELNHYKNTINLEDRFDYNFSIADCGFLNNQEKSEINNELNTFKKNTILKHILNFKLNNDFNQPNIHYWIINKWGGIKNFKKNEKNDKKILEFRSCLINNTNINQRIFSNISSLSKIASFSEIDNYFIYDSRVIYSFNWLLLKYPTPEVKFFPTPFGRNKTILDFNLLPIINFKNINSPNPFFYNYKTAYHKYCEIIKVIATEIFPNEKPFLLEMLLYTISIKEIFEDIKTNLQIIITHTH